MSILIQACDTKGCGKLACMRVVNDEGKNPINYCEAHCDTSFKEGFSATPITAPIAVGLNPNFNEDGGQLWSASFGTDKSTTNVDYYGAGNTPVGAVNDLLSKFEQSNQKLNSASAIHDKLIQAQESNVLAAVVCEAIAQGRLDPSKNLEEVLKNAMDEVMPE